MRTEQMIDEEIRQRYAEIVGRDQAIIKMINSWDLPASVIAMMEQAEAAKAPINVRELKRRAK